MLIRVSVHCFVLYFALGIAYSEICNLPDGGMGKCVSINQCPRLLGLVRSNRRDAKVIRYVRSLQCGAKHNVCCSDCYTPEGKSGTCVPIQECPNLLNLLNTNMNYVRNSMCMSGGTDVCCGPPPPAQPTRGRCQAQLTAFPPDPETKCCGVEATAAPRIIGGTSTGIDQYPWLVLLEYRKGDRVATLCGGSLISNKYVVTAAHCVPDKRLPFSVRVGEYDTENPGADCVSAPAGGQDCNFPPISVPIKRIVKHPEYNTTYQRNDIALIELADAVAYTDFVRPICLPTEDISNVPNAEVYVAGWGQISDSITRSRFKQHVKIPLVDTQDCQNNYYSRRFELKSKQIPMLWTRQLCAGGEAGKDSCRGDSGGPLMFESSVNNDKTYTLDGITSFGPNKCGTEGLAGVYTKVFDYNTWIRRNIVP